MIVETLVAAQDALYRASPFEMRSHFNRERTVEREYRGRQILELLQNADDSGRGYAGKPRFLVRVSGNYLVAANAGQPFSIEGLTSLVVSDRSPKQLSRGRYIGQKGLGFRALLAWSKRLIISSGAHLIGFSPEHARGMAVALAAEVPSLHEDLAAYEREYGVLPVPVMRFPYIPAPEDPRVQIANATRGEGFDTVIVLELPATEGGASVLADIEEQAAVIGAPTLLFSNHLREIKVQVGVRETVWLVHRDIEDEGKSLVRDDEAWNEEVVVTEGPSPARALVLLERDGAPSLWTVHRTELLVPEGIAEDGGRGMVGLAVAVPDEVPRDSIAATLPALSENAPTLGSAEMDSRSAASTSHHTLCVYFPTSVALPMAMLAHATLETDESRKRLIEGPATVFALNALAAFIARIAGAEAMSSRGSHSSWRGLELLAGVERCDPELMRLGFRDAVLRAIRAEQLFPRLDGRVVDADDVRLAPSAAWARVATPDWLGEVLAKAPSQAVEELVGQLSLFKLSQTEQANRLSQRMVTAAAAGQLKYAGELVGTLLDARALPSQPLAVVLLDEGGLPLPATAAVLLPPESAAPQFPEWAKGLHFLHPALVEGLRARVKATGRELARRLTEGGYKVEEYHLETVARRLLRLADEADAADAAAATGAGPTSIGDGATAIKRHHDILRFVYDMTKVSTDRVSDDAAPTVQGPAIGAPFKVVTQTGALRRASECYVGVAYPNGPLLTALFGPLGSDEFCAGPEALGLDVPAPALEPFLARIGVATRVRLVPLRTSWEVKQAGLEQHTRETLARLQYPQVLAERRFENADDAYADLAVQYVGATLPDRWREVLRAGSPEAIVAYVASNGLQRLDPAQATGIQFQARHGLQQNFRPCPSVPVSDPTLFLLRESAWVPCEDGERHPPRHVALTRLGRKALGRAFRAHSLDVTSPLLASTGGTTAVLTVLQASGAVQALEALRGDDLYALLLELPGRDPSGEVAPSVYRSLLEAGQHDVVSPRRTEFLASGVMWGAQGGMTGYFPIHRLRYASRTAVPEPVKRQVPLLAVDARRSASDVERVFGVKSLDPRDYDIIVEEQLNATPWSERANRHLRSTLAHLYALRLSQRADDRGDERRAFVDLTLVVTPRLVAHVRIEGGPPEAEVLDADLSGLTSGRRMFIVSHDLAFSHDLVLWRAVADLVADVINVPRASGDFGPLLACTSESQRTRLLDHMTGGRAVALLADAREALAISGIDEEDEGFIVSVPPPPQDAHVNRPAMAAVATVTATDVAGITGAVGVAPPSRGVIPIDPPAGRGSRPRDLVIARDPGNVDEDDDAEREPPIPESDTLKVAELFERLAEPPRYSMRVAHLRGGDALGCDLISFATAESRDRMIAAQEVNLLDVLRFIEVKGASTRTGTTELTYNERSAAERFGARYFIYRVYVDRLQPAQSEVAVLADPTSSPREREQLRWSYAFSAGSGAEWFRLPLQGQPVAHEVPPPDA